MDRFRACTVACETADQRVWDETAPQNGTGAACPAPTACNPGDGVDPVECTYEQPDPNSYL